uniref:Peptidase metallopeptidase domain-containing protein n=1 Tax=Kalanchoe fedtschenkoi TaxID=63787 RepID=A0A7N0TZB2_KALFE
MASKALVVAYLAALLVTLQALITQVAPFDFVKQLKGCHKGDRVKGVGDLKKYLEHFGYLHYPNSSDSHSKDDDFDDLLERAVKTYQANFHLNPSGTLDDDMISTMMRPRCGVPDIVNGSNWMQSGKLRRQHHHNSKSFHQVSHYSFFPGSPRWPRTKLNLTYGFHASVPSEHRNSIARAFGRWAAVTRRFSFSQTSSYELADLTVLFGSRAHGDNSPFDGRGGTLAHAYAPTDGRMHFDADELWSNGAAPRRYDVYTVALHEIGHLLGLGHSDVQNAIMFPSISSNTVKDMAGDDFNGINALYN